MQDKILLTNMEFFGCHGCSQEERNQPQPFIIDVELFLDLSKSGKSDDLNDTVDYIEVFKLVEQIVTGKSKNLIEALAEDIAASILKNFPLIESLQLKIRKPKPPVKLAFDGAAVSIFRMR